MPTSGVAKMAASAADTVTSAMAFARRPAERSVRPIHVHAAAMSPVRPASGPIEPPKTMGSRKPTTLFPAPSTR